MFYSAKKVNFSNSTRCRRFTRKLHTLKPHKLKVHCAEELMSYLIYYLHSRAAVEGIQGRQRPPLFCKGGRRPPPTIEIFFVNFMVKQAKLVKNNEKLLKSSKITILN